jgi:predicted ABC-type ATPase
VIVLAGPNGAGKTTASRSLLAETLGVMTFVNADVIAQGLSGFDPASAAIEASRIMLARLHALADQRVSFAFETTLAARTLAGWLGGLGQTGYRVELFYFWLASADVAVNRVAVRVSAGGHAVPEATIRQRYQRSIENFLTLYRPVVSVWRAYDNTQTGPPRLIASGDGSGNVNVTDPAVWLQMQQMGSSP